MANFTSSVDPTHLTPAGIAKWYIRGIQRTGIDYLSNGITYNFGISAVAPTIADDKICVLRRTAPANATINTDYWVVNSSSNEFALSETEHGDPLAVDAHTGKLDVVDHSYVDLYSLYEGKISVQSVAEMNTKKQSIDSAGKIALSGKLYNTDKATMLLFLNVLAQNNIEHAVKTVGGVWFGMMDVEGTVNYMGTKWKFVCDGDSDKMRYIELSASVVVDKVNIPLFFDRDPITIGTIRSGDVLYGMEAATEQTGIYPAGIQKFEISHIYSGSYQNVGSVMNGKVIIELLTTPDADGMEIGYGAKVDIEVRAQQSSADELAQLGNLSGQDTFAKLTLLDGTVLTFASSGGQQIGIAWDAVQEKDSDGLAYIKYTGTGIIPISALDSIFV